MQDSELLELAAKAAGYVEWDGDDALSMCCPSASGSTKPWRPLTDDGDALRLAAALGMRIDFDKHRVVYKTRPDAIIYLKFGIKWQGKDGFRAAITRAAAEIGKNS